MRFSFIYIWWETLLKKRYSSMPPFSKLALPNNLRIAATTVRSTDLQQAMPIVTP
jgi:hypothetical protein